jgi:hypothetical protein
MGGEASRPPMVELFGNQKALWELTIRFCRDWKLIKRAVLKVVDRVKKWHANEYRFVLIPDPRIHADFEVYLARRKIFEKKTHRD